MTNEELLQARTLQAGLENHRAGRLRDAAEAYQQVLDANPKQADALYLLGVIAHQTGNQTKALELFQQTLSVWPEHTLCHHMLGMTLRGVGKPDEAARFLKTASTLSPNDPAMHCDFGDVLQEVSQYAEAISEYRKALELNPELARAWYSIGCAENARSEYVAASTAFQAALQINPSWAEAQHNLGQALFHLGQVNEAFELFKQAASGPHPELPRAMMAVIVPGSSKAGNEIVLSTRRNWVEGDLPKPATTKRSVRRAKLPGQPLRIGYVSSFFHRKNWMKPVWGLINQHDRENFEIHLFSDAPETAIEHGYRKHAADHFHDINGVSNQAVAEQIERAEIDVLVDLNGYSRMQRLPLFTLRPAPVTAGWFNMFATTGMPYFDYLIGDAEVIPPEEEKFYSERIVRVPGSYLTFDVSYPVPDVANSPCSIGGRITFGCLAPLYKITGEVIAAWSKILKHAPAASLILRNAALGSAATQQFVHDRFAEHDIASERIVLYRPAEHYRFLQTYDEIDIALDTFPYNGGTTTTEAIWQGVPVVTFFGDRWASRTTTSIERAGNLSEFVGRDLDEYIALAVGLANAPNACTKLGELRRAMRSRLSQSPVCDTRNFARNMEQLYRQMYMS